MSAEPHPEDESDDIVAAPARSVTGGAAPERSAERLARRGLLERAVPDRTVRRIVEWVGLIVLALVAAFLLRTFVVQSFYIPSTSMTPALQVGDRVLVNKLSYRFGDPGRGDIVVFEAPPGEGNREIKDLIKRVIGLPGETIEGRDGRVYIDGKALEEPWLPKGIQSRTFGPEKVPADHYWVLGDNRFDSRDSTFFKSIPRGSIVGEGFVRIWPLTDLSTL